MHLPTIGIKTEYMPLADAIKLSSVQKNSILGLINFSTNFTVPNTAPHLPLLQVVAPVLAGEAFACEALLVNAESNLTAGRQGAIHYQCNETLLFGVMHLDESQHAPNASASNADIPPLQITTESAYRQITALMNSLGYPHVYRFWNYMADINVSSHGLERYQQFNIGRKQVLTDIKREAGKQLPAACALGLANGPLCIAFLVGRIAATAIENPRQVSAYEYPERYGPSTPSFSRACLLNTPFASLLFISGTASIIGHQTQHPQDVIAQTRETLMNIEAVIAEANQELKTPKLTLQNASLRVYVRFASDLPLVQAEITRYFADKINAVLIQADICRAELLLEIEATLQSPVAHT